MIAVADLLAETRSFRSVVSKLWWSGRWVRRYTLREALVQPLEHGRAAQLALPPR